MTESGDQAPVISESSGWTEFWFVSSHSLTKLGDALMSPKTTLSWVGAAVGAPTWAIALFVPLRESGSMLPQFWSGGLLGRFSLRKHAWALGSLLQGLSVLAMAWVALRLSGLAAGLALLALLAAFSLARSLNSVSSKDVLGRTVSKQRRGRVTGWASAAAGLASLAVAVWGIGFGAKHLSANELALVLSASGASWLVAIALFLRVDEPRDSYEDAWDSAIQRLQLLKEDRRLLRFVIARALLLCSALSTPYLVVMAQRSEQGASLFQFMAVAALSSLVFGPLWGRAADSSSRTVLSLAAVLAALVGFAAGFTALLGDALLTVPWALLSAFAVISVAHEGVRIGRKTWIVNIAEGQQRRDYVAVSNSAIGAVLLLVGALTAVLAEWELGAALIALSVAGAAGAWLSWRLPEAE